VILLLGPIVSGGSLGLALLTSTLVPESVFVSLGALSFISLQGLIVFSIFGKRWLGEVRASEGNHDVSP